MWEYSLLRYLHVFPPHGMLTIWGWVVSTVSEGWFLKHSEITAFRTQCVVSLSFRRYFTALEKGNLVFTKQGKKEFAHHLKILTTWTICMCAHLKNKKKEKSTIPLWLILFTFFCLLFCQLALGFINAIFKNSDQFPCLILQLWSKYSCSETTVLISSHAVVLAVYSWVTNLTAMAPLVLINSASLLNFIII